MKKTFLWIVQILLLIGSISLEAQEKVFLASTSSKYPYERGQWTKAEADAWQKKYGPIIGVNHPMGPNPDMSRLEYLKKAKELGFNSVRMFVGGSTADEYIANVKSWADDCASVGMTLSPVITCPGGYFSQTDQSAALVSLEKFIRKVIQAFRGDDRIVLWDIWNEPEMYDETKCLGQMAWIKKMVVWCRQEGCTQPITCSIIWDASIPESNASNKTALREARNEAEAMMDLHNYHDYCVSENHNQNTAVMVARIKAISDRPLVCTECLARVTGATIPRTLSEFAKYHINFYIWGLYASNYNWEVKWGRSTYYAWEPLFHEMLYADGEAYNPSELPWIKNFKFAAEGENTDPGAEVTEMWSQRRAWKWMSRDATKGLSYSSVSEALTGVQNHATDSIYNSVHVNLNIQDYLTNQTTFFSDLDNLLSAADKAGMTVLPTLLAGDDINRAMSVIEAYAYNVVSRYYHDARIMGWDVYHQVAGTSESVIDSKIGTLMRYVRYDFPNQPLLMTPLVSESVLADSTSTDVANKMWQLSDVLGYETTDGTSVTDTWLTTLSNVYGKPIFCLGTGKTESNYATQHVNWYANSEQGEDVVKAFSYKPILKKTSEAVSRWQGWRTWEWMNRNATKGLYYSSMSSAIAGVKTHAEDKLYNSVRVLLDYNDYTTDATTFYIKMDSLIQLAGKSGMTVLPTLLTDKYAGEEETALSQYVGDVVKHYAQNDTILAWDLYFRPGSGYKDNSKLSTLVPHLFETARSGGPQQPLFMTPAVSVQDMGDKYIDQTTHGSSSTALVSWYKFQYPTTGATSALCYQIWTLSDVIGFNTMQQSPEMGMLEDVAYRFGRPLFCSQWKTTVTETPDKVLSFFANMHTNWYVDGNLDDSYVKNFKFIPVTTEH